MNGLLRILIFVVPLILVYVISYYFNSKTEKPEGIEEIDKCSVCNSDTCSVRDLKDSLDEFKCDFDDEKMNEENN